MKKYEEFILNIFNQPYEQAYRRSKLASPYWHENYLRQNLHISG